MSTREIILSKNLSTPYQTIKRSNNFFCKYQALSVLEQNMFWKYFENKHLLKIFWILKNICYDVEKNLVVEMFSRKYY